MMTSNFRTAAVLLLTVIAQSSRASDPPPEIVAVGMVTPSVMAVTLHEGSVSLGKLVPYQARPGDEVRIENVQRSSVRRDGHEIGTLVGREGHQMIRTPDHFVGVRLDRKRLVSRQSWSIAGGPKVRAVSFKNRVLDAANIEGNDWKASYEFIVFLTLDQSLSEGRYTILHDGVAQFNFDWSPHETVSPAVHVSAVGFRPRDPGKRATLTCWTGDGLTIDYLTLFPELRFRVIEHTSGREAMVGTVEQKQEAEQADDYTGLWGRPNGSKFNRSGGPVFSMDLAGLTQPGTYRVVVDGIGCSKPFRIDEDVYSDLWRLSLRGLHVHRRNVSVEVESVDGRRWTRPAADDSMAVHSTARFGNATFAAFNKGATDRPAPNTRGGWMDAGDFDSSHNHYWASLLLLDLIDRHPNTLGADDVGISDSGNGLPDLLDEGLWMIDSYRDMQTADGSLPSGIEYSEHPRHGEPSYLNSLPIYQLAPSPLATFRYAAASARAARVLQYGGFQTSEPASVYLNSATAAFDWAESHRGDPAPDSKESVEDARLLASCELMLAGHRPAGSAWIEHTDHLVQEPWSVARSEVAEAIVAHLQAGGPDLTKERGTALSTVLYQTVTMSYLDGSTRRNGFGVLKNGWAPFGYGTGGCPRAECRHVVMFPQVVPTDQPFPPHIRPDRNEYVAAGVTGLAFLLGHHPTNRPLVTGLETLQGVDDSWHSVHNILHLDSRYSSHRAPVGITVYGSVKPIRNGDSWPVEWPLNRDQTIHPTYEQWPEYENLHQFPLWGAMMEYTVWQSVAPTLWFAAELDARER